MERLIPLLGALAGATLFWLAYNAFFHPLRKYPGPLLNRASVIPKQYYLMKGTLPFHVADLHAQYGPVVRIAPNELAFTDPQAWKDIYTRKHGERNELPHDMAFYNATGHPNRSILNSSRVEHDAIRKLLGPGFSDRAMKAQEPVINGYVSLLMRRLREHGTNSDTGMAVPLDMRDWIAYFTFDMIGTLAFGNDFGCLENSSYHPWIKLIIGALKDMARLHTLKALGVIKGVWYLMHTFNVGKKAVGMHVALVTEKTKQRIEMGTGRDDFLDGLIKSGLSFNQVMENGGLLIVAGSETTATLLTGALFLLCTNRHALEKLTKEVREQFTREDEITLSSVTKLSYMLAVLKEALRCYPPVAITSPRVTPPEGAQIAGHVLPGGVTVGVWQWAMYRDPQHFADPERFDPERFANPGVGKYATDRLDAMNPFLLGPRNCIGQNLAYAEMRLVMARLIWGFDMELAKGNDEWLTGQKNYLLWDKPELKMYLREVTTDN